MRWRRGLLLAGIHFIVAVCLMTSILLPRFATEKIHSFNRVPTIQFAAYQEEGQSLGFEPMCEWGFISWQEKVLMASELPAAFLSGWNDDCPARWTAAGLIGIDARHHTHAKELASSVAFSLLIVAQWFVIGGFPLIRPRRWWLEPGACNTAATVVEVLLLTVGTAFEAAGIERVLVAFGLLAFPLGILTLLSWLVWVALLVRKIANSSWKLATSNGRSS